MGIPPEVKPSDLEPKAALWGSLETKLTVPLMVGSPAEKQLSLCVSCSGKSAGILFWLLDRIRPDLLVLSLEEPFAVLVPGGPGM